MISNKTDYALRLLINLATNLEQELIPSRQIAEEEQIPPNFLPQIVASLVKKGWVESVRGPGGGVRLAVEPAQITVLDVIELFEEVQVRQCVHDPGVCTRAASCPLRKVLGKAESQMQQVLRKSTIADLLNEES